MLLPEQRGYFFSGCANKLPREQTPQRDLQKCGGVRFKSQNNVGCGELPYLIATIVGNSASSANALVELFDFSSFKNFTRIRKNNCQAFKSLVNFCLFTFSKQKINAISVTFVTERKKSGKFLMHQYHFQKDNWGVCLPARSGWLF